MQDQNVDSVDLREKAYLFLILNFSGCLGL